MSGRARFSSNTSTTSTRLDPVPSYSTSNLRAYTTPEGTLKISSSRSASPVLSSSLLSSRRYVTSKPEPVPTSSSSSLAERVAERIASAPSSSSMRHKDEDEERWRRPLDDSRSLIAEHAKMKEKEKKDREDFDFIAKEKERLSREKSVSPTRPSVADQSVPRTYTRTDSTSTSSPTRIKRPEYYSSGKNPFSFLLDLCLRSELEFCIVFLRQARGSLFTLVIHSPSELKLPTYEAASRFLNSASTALSQKPLARCKIQHLLCQLFM